MRVPVEGKSEPVGRELLLNLSRLMLRPGGSEEEQANAVAYLCALNMIFAAVGRAGECGMSSSRHLLQHTRWCSTCRHSLRRTVQTTW